LFNHPQYDDDVLDLGQRQNSDYEQQGQEDANPRLNDNNMNETPVENSKLNDYANDQSQDDGQGGADKVTTYKTFGKKSRN
jgi:hypothetical protein